MKTFEQFIGNANTVRTMRAAVRSGRIANAYLFSGPVSVGKRTLAMICAAALLCREEGDEPCGECSSCKRIARIGGEGGFHPDLHCIEPDGKFIKVDQIRKDLVAQVQMQPHESARQVFIIDPAEAMHISAANAFLKTLEEAPGRSVFFLISANPAGLPTTILSRCQRLNLQRMPLADLAKRLAETQELDAHEARLRAALSRGAPAAALTFDIEVYRTERKTALEFVRLALGEGNASQVFSLAKALNAESERFPGRLDLILTVLRDTMLIASVGSGAEIINIDIRDALIELARGRSPRRIAHLTSLLAEMKEPLVRNVRVDSVSEHVMLAGRRLFRTGA